MKWGVWAIPPKIGIFSDLKPRFQMWNNGQVCEYSAQEDAQAWADECNSCYITKWKYEARKIH